MKLLVKKYQNFRRLLWSQGAVSITKKLVILELQGFSFYWGHHMSTIESGMITTNDKNFTIYVF